MASSPSAVNIIWGSPGTNPGAAPANGFLFSSTVYIENTNGFNPLVIQLGVYTDTPGRPNVLLAQTPTLNLPAAFLGWATINHTTLAPIVAGSVYWTVVSCACPTNPRLWFRAGGSRCYGNGNIPPVPFPNPYPGGGFIDAFETAIYSTCTTSITNAVYVPYAACCKQNNSL